MLIGLAPACSLRCRWVEIRCQNFASVRCHHGGQWLLANTIPKATIGWGEGAEGRECLEDIAELPLFTVGPRGFANLSAPESVGGSFKLCLRAYLRHGMLKRWGRIDYS